MPTVTVIQPTIAEEKDTLIRCAAYCRVSSDSEDQLNSFMAQTRYYGQIFEHSETETLIDIYADEGVTGTRDDKREEFQRMMKDCRKGKIDRIYTKSISRFARNTKDCLKNIRELKSLGITVFFEKENIDTANMTDEMMITIMGGLAQEESTSISQNMRWSVQKRMQNGTYVLPHAPYGYRIENKQLIIVEEEAKIIRLIYDSYLNGLGTEAIANLLNQKSDKRKWSSIAVRYILTNEKYTGNSLWHKTCTTTVLPYKTIINNGCEEKYYAENTHDAIIPQEQFDKVQQLMSSRSFEVKKCICPLSQKIYCGECGTMFRIKHINGSTYWECRNHNTSAKNCSIKQISEQRFYNAFITLYNKLFYNYKQILVPLQIALQDLKLRRFSGNSNVMEIHKEIAKLKEQTHVLARLKTKGFLDNGKYLEQTSELNANVNKLQSELKKITHLDDEDETLDQIEMLIDYFEKQENPITEFDKSAFENIVEKIIVISQNVLEFHVIGGLKFKEKI
ncbi:MAG: recombinase family protein [Clostridium sp.]|nr:recombinase family protein [Clostridium sp.]